MGRSAREQRSRRSAGVHPCDVREVTQASLTMVTLRVARRRSRPTGRSSLRVNPWRLTRAYRCARQRTNRLHRHGTRSDAPRRGYALVARLKDPGRTRPCWSGADRRVRPPGRWPSGQCCEIGEKCLDVRDRLRRHRLRDLDRGGVELPKHGRAIARSEDLLGADVEQRRRRIGVGERRPDRDGVLIAQLLLDVVLVEAGRGRDCGRPDELALEVAPSPSTGVEVGPPGMAIDEVRADSLGGLVVTRPSAPYAPGLSSTSGHRPSNRGRGRVAPPTPRGSTSTSMGGDSPPRSPRDRARTLSAQPHNTLEQDPAAPAATRPGHRSPARTVSATAPPSSCRSPPHASTRTWTSRPTHVIVPDMAGPPH
jgi:hypothetical protein